MEGSSVSISNNNDRIQEDLNVCVQESNVLQESSIKIASQENIISNMTKDGKDFILDLSSWSEAGIERPDQINNNIYSSASEDKRELGIEQVSANETQSTGKLCDLVTSNLSSEKENIQTIQTQDSIDNSPEFKMHKSARVEPKSSHECSLSEHTINNDDVDNSKAAIFGDDRFRHMNSDYGQSQEFKSREFLRSDSNSMFEPRFKTKPCDPSVSPIKSARKIKPVDQEELASFGLEEENQYKKEEHGRRRSLSKLNLSSNKPKTSLLRLESHISTTSMIQTNGEVSFFNELSFNREFSDLQKETGDEENSLSFQALPTLSADKRTALEPIIENEVANADHQEKVEISRDPPHHDEFEKPVRNRIASNNDDNWSTFTEPANESSLRTTEAFVEKQIDSSQNNATDHSATHLKSKCDFNASSLSKSSSEGQSLAGSNAEESANKNSFNNLPPGEVNVRSGNESSEVETKRDEGRYDIKFSSPVTKKMGNSSMIEENFDGETTIEPMAEESVRSITGSVKTPNILSKGTSFSPFLTMSGESSSACNPSNLKIRNNTKEEVSPFNHDEGNALIRNKKKLSYMERKLQKLEEENLKSMGDFKKSYSRLEREKMKRENELRDENVNALVSNRRGSNENSSLASSSRKHYTKLQLEKMDAKENQSQVDTLQNEKALINLTPRAHLQTVQSGTEGGMGVVSGNLPLEVKSHTVDQVQTQEGKVQSVKLPAIAQATRTPLQMIQSEAERDTMMIHETSSPNEKNNSLTINASQKKRTYDGISSIETYQYSTELNTLKKMKKGDENQMESLDEMLSKSKKKIPRIQMEKIMNREKERREKERLLKEMSVNYKDAIFKVEDPIGFSRGFGQSLNSRSSFGDNKSQRDSLSGKSNSRNSSSRNSLSLSTNNTCVLCGNASEMETLIRKFNCSHKAHMNCIKGNGNRDCPVCSSRSSEQNYLKR